MSHPYFQEDGFVEKFGPELKHLVDDEKEKESIDRNKRRKQKKVSVYLLVIYKYGTNQSRGSLQDIDNVMKKR